MEWIKSMQKAISYIEANLLEDIDIEQIAESIYTSSTHFQRIFSITTGITAGDYIRYRRLSLAGREIADLKNGNKIIYIAMKYGYDTAESFTKAFIRFHGITPSAAKKSAESLKYFAPFVIQINIKGGFNMNRKIIPNIPEIGYYGNETDFDVNILEATFNIAGTKMDRTELSFYSGMANHFCWIEGNWVGSRGCECFGCINETPFQEELRLLKIIGWSAKYVHVSRDKDGKMLNTDEEQIKCDFIESIDKGYPILSRRTNSHRYSIIVGYEDDGNIIVCKEAVDGESENDHKDAETFVHENWQDVILDYIVLKERLEPVPERQRILEQLKLITARARRTDKIRGFISSGIAAWETYLYMLEHEDLSVLPLDEPGKDSVALRFGIYCDGLCQIWERHAALNYYRSLAEKYPEWREELNIAVAALDECSKYGGFLWTQGHSFTEAGYEKFRDPASRKILADEGRKAMMKDIEAIEQFEKILKKEKKMINFLNDSKKLTYTAEVDGGIMNMSYLLFAPNGYENMESLPIVLFLHGNGETWSDETSETLILQKMINDSEFSCIIIAPKCISERNWCDWQMATLALGLTNEIKNAYNCDSERFYIIGFEMGAYAIYDLIGFEPHNNGVAGAVTIGGAYMYELIENIKRVPLWVFYGDRDYSSSDSKKMVAELEKAGGNYKSTDYTSVDNMINFICDETDLFIWLFAQKNSLKKY